jgi:hypothetical protein
MRVAGDLVHPRSKGSLGLVGFPVFQDPEKDVLDQILAEVAIPVYVDKVVEKRSMVPLKQHRQSAQVAIPDGLHQATIACFVHNLNTGVVTKGYAALVSYSVVRLLGSLTEQPIN